MRLVGQLIHVCWCSIIHQGLNCCKQYREEALAPFEELWLEDRNVHVQRLLHQGVCVVQYAWCALGTLSLCPPEFPDDELPLQEFEAVLQSTQRLKDQLEAMPAQVQAGCVLIDSTPIHEAIVELLVLWKNDFVNALRRYLTSAVETDRQFTEVTLVRALSAAVLCTAYVSSMCRKPSSPCQAA